MPRLVLSCRKRESRRSHRRSQQLILATIYLTTLLFIKASRRAIIRRATDWFITSYTMSSAAPGSVAPMQSSAARTVANSGGTGSNFRSFQVSCVEGEEEGWRGMEGWMRKMRYVLIHKNITVLLHWSIYFSRSQYLYASFHFQYLSTPMRVTISQMVHMRPIRTRISLWKLGCQIVGLV